MADGSDVINRTLLKVYGPIIGTILQSVEFRGLIELDEIHHEEAPENISPDQLVGEHVCDIDCWDNFYVMGDSFGDPILGCRHRDMCPGVDHTITFSTLGDVITSARKHCKEYHQ